MRRAAFLTILWFINLALGVSRLSAAPPVEGKLPDPRDRRQFEQVETFCAEQLADPKLSEARRVELTLERARNLADYALESPPAGRPALWERSRRVVDEFIAGHPRHPRLALIRAQGALAALAEGELASEEAELSNKQPPRDAARNTLRGAIGQLRRLDEEVAAEVRQSAQTKRGANESAMSVAELMSLDANLRYHLARGLRNQSLCYPTKSADRINSLAQSLELLSALSQQTLTERLAWNVRLDEIACRRLLEEYGTAEQKLTQAENRSPPADVVPRLTAERIRLALARGRIDEALAEAGNGAARRQANSPEADLARLEAYLAAWQRAAERQQKPDTTEWEATAIDQVRTIEQHHGQPWLRKAEGLWSRALARRAGSESVAGLVLGGDGLYRNGQIDEALAAYDQAARRAREERHADQALEIAFTAATIEKEREHFRSATDRYRKLAMVTPNDPRAPEAHLLAIYCAGQLAEKPQVAEKPAKADKQPAPKLDEYERLLREHVATWPRAATASQAWWWLGRLEEHQRVYPEAIRALRNVTPDHAQYAAAIEAAGRCYLAWFAQLHRDGKPVEAPAQDAVRHFEQAIVRPGVAAASTKPAARAAALAAARIYLAEIPNGSRQAESLLSTALRDAQDAPKEWQNAARSLLVAALAAQDRLPQAEQVLEQLTIGAPADELALVNTLADLAERAPAKDRDKQGRSPALLELRILDDLLAKREELDAATLAEVTRLRAGALAHAGRRNEAIAAWETLAAANARDGRAQEELATLLATSNDTEELRAAIAKWREIATKSRPGTPRWFRAHLALARTQLDLGEAAQARATLQRVAVSQPQLGGAEFKPRFEQLSAECERAAVTRAESKK